MLLSVNHYLHFNLKISNSNFKIKVLSLEIEVIFRFFKIICVQKTSSALPDNYHQKKNFTQWLILAESIFHSELVTSLVNTQMLDLNSHTIKKLLIVVAWLYFVEYHQINFLASFDRGNQYKYAWRIPMTNMWMINF